LSYDKQAANVDPPTSIRRPRNGLSG